MAMLACFAFGRGFSTPTFSSRSSSSPGLGGPTLRTSSGLFSPRVEKLMIGSRDHTPLVASVHKQMRLVDDALASAGLAHILTFGMLGFVEVGGRCSRATS